MIEKDAINVLRELRAKNARKKISRIRDLFDEITSLEEEGFTHAQIVESLRTINLTFTSVQAFEVTLYRVRRERQNSPKQASNSRSEAVGNTELVEKEIVRSIAGREQAFGSTNPLRALSEKHREGDFIPRAKFEVDEN